MEKLNLPVYIQCPSHPAEVIQRVDLNMPTKKQLFCLDCALQYEDPKALLLTLQTLPNFVITAANFYAQCKNKIRTNGERPPQEYLQIVQEKPQNLNNLAQHIQEEKARVEFIFNKIYTDIIELLNEKKDEYFEILDKQMFNMQIQYDSFEKQLKKCYPSPQDIPYLFPTKEEIEQRMAKLPSASQLDYFVKSVKEDMNQERMNEELSELDPQSKKAYFNGLILNLKACESIKPTSGIESIDLNKIRNSIKQILDKYFEKEEPVKNQIPDTSIIQNAPESSILKPEDFLLVRKWLPSKYRPTLKLLYRGSRDGLNPKEFHAKCDYKGPTMTFIKCQFNQSAKISVIGGFIDQDWHQQGECIASENAFLFSITSQVKCPVSNPQFAAYGGPKNGPRFGNCDIQMYSLKDDKFDQTLVRPSSFLKTAKIVESTSYPGSGEINFKLMDMEVYQVK